MAEPDCKAATDTKTCSRDVLLGSVELRRNVQGPRSWLLTSLSPSTTSTTWYLGLSSLDEPGQLVPVRDPLAAATITITLHPNRFWTRVNVWAWNDCSTVGKPITCVNPGMSEESGNHCQNGSVSAPHFVISAQVFSLEDNCYKF